MARNGMGSLPDNPMSGNALPKSSIPQPPKSTALDRGFTAPPSFAKAGFPQQGKSRGSNTRAGFGPRAPKGTAGMRGPRMGGGVRAPRMR